MEIIDKLKKRVLFGNNKVAKGSNLNYAELIAKELEVSTEEAAAMLCFAKDNYGIESDQYYKNKYYKMSEAEMVTKHRRKNNIDQKAQDRYEAIERLSGKNRKQVDEEIKELKKKTDAFQINLKWYFSSGAYMLDVLNGGESINGFIQTCIRKEALKKEIKSALAMIDECMGDYDAIQGKLDEFKILTEKTLSEARKEQLLKIIEKDIIFKSDKELTDTLIDMEMTYQLLDFSPNEYFMYHFWDKTVKERREYVSSKLRLKYIKALNSPEGRELLDSKYDTYIRVKDLYKREIVLLDAKTGYETFLDYCNRHNVFVKKNNYDSLGRGVQKVNLEGYTSKREAYEDVTADAKRVILEELIIPGPEIQFLNPDSVNTVRIILLMDESAGCKIQDTFMKIGREGSFVDNGGAGGILVHIDPDSGVFDSDGIDEDCNVYTIHPDHGYAFAGYHLPKWGKAVETARAASAKIPEAKYIGWDLTYTNDGNWIIVEGNSKTQFIGQQVTTGHGIRKEFLETVRPLVDL